MASNSIESFNREKNKDFSKKKSIPDLLNKKKKFNVITKNLRNKNKMFNLCFFKKVRREK